MAASTSLKPARRGTQPGTSATHVAPYASEEYVARHGAPEHPRELRDHRCVAHPAMRGRGGWELSSGDQDPALFEIGEGTTVNDFRLIASCVRRGAGVGLIPELIRHGAGEERDLRRVLPGWRGSGGSLWLVWPASRHTAPRIRAFVDQVSELPLEADPWAPIAERQSR